MPFNDKLPIMVSAAAGPTGLAFVFAHGLPNGGEISVGHGSTTLTLSIMQAVKQYHRYLAVRKFIISTYPKPMLGVFDPKKK